MHARPDAVVRQTAGGDHIVEGGDAVGQVAAEAEHEAHRKPRGGDIAQRLRRRVFGKMGNAEQRLRLQRIANPGDLQGPPQHGHRGDGEPGPPGAEQCQGSLDEIWQLQDNPVAALEPKPDEEGGERIHRCIRLAVGQGARPRIAEQLPIGRIA